MNSKFWKTLVISERKTTYNKDVWEIPSRENWYLIKLVSGIPTDSVVVEFVYYHRLFISENKATTLKLVDNMGELWKK